jgi:nucleoside-diphosphate-sugar epimerase
MTAQSHRIVIIGGDGFIASALLAHLAENHSNIEACSLSKQEFDITDPLTWKTFPSDTTTVIHAAAQINGDLYDIFKVNAFSAEPLAGFLNKQNINRLIYLSTGAVYGHISTPTQPDMPASPEGPYAVSKYLAERIFQEQFTGKLNILRLYFPYGPSQKLPRLIPQLRDNIIKGNAVFCNSDGGPNLSLTHINDICKIICDDVLFTEDSPRIANIAAANHISMQSIIQQLAETIGQKAVIKIASDHHDSISINWPRKFNFTSIDFNF